MNGSYPSLRLSILTLLVLMLAFSLAVSAKTVPDNWVCTAPGMAPKIIPPTVTGMKMMLNDLPTIYTGQSLTLAPLVTWTNRRLTPDYSATSSDPSGLGVERKADGTLTIIGNRPGSYNITLTPDQGKSRAITVPVTVKEIPTRTIPGAAAAVSEAKAVACPPTGIPWWVWLLLALAAILAGLLGYVIARSRARRSRQEDIDNAYQKGYSAAGADAENRYQDGLAAGRRDGAEELARVNRQLDITRQALRETDVALLRAETRQANLIDEATRDIRIELGRERERAARAERRVQELEMLLNQMSQQLETMKQQIAAVMPQPVA